MYGTSNQDILRFFVAGINYKKTDASMRGQFAVSPDNYERILSQSPDCGVNEMFILSTCNRTEIYGITSDPLLLIDLLCQHTEGDRNTFRSMAYTKCGVEAIEHLHHVSAGLDSQILGDYEIVGQLKQAVKFAKDRSRVGGFIERLVNSVLQSSKTIKNNTILSGGTVSVSFAAVQYIRQHVKDQGNKKVLLAGIGKIGRNTCRNLVDYLQVKEITLINRTDEKSEQLAAELGLRFAPFSSFHQEVKEADIIVASTNAPNPIIFKTDIAGAGEKTLIDLSIPYNIDPAARELPGVRLVNVDELSKLKDNTLNKRKAEVPKAKAIIDEHIREFVEWYEMRKYVPVLIAVKTKLQELHGHPLFFRSAGSCTGLPPADHKERIQKVINGMAVKMRQHNQRGCHYIEAINEFMTPGVN